MFLRSYNGQVYGLWCGKCGTMACVCNDLPKVGDVSYHTAMAAWGVESVQDLSALAVEFYQNVAKRYAGMDYDAARITRIADIIAYGAAVSCFGEARYEFACAFHELARRAKPKYVAEGWHKSSRWFQMLKKIQIPLAPHDVYISRDEFVGAVIPPMTPLEIARWARNILRDHLKFTGASGGYGGVLWWEGADLTYRYLSGKLSATVYADLMFNAMHNGGNLLNKVFLVNQNLTAVLDFKRTAKPHELITAFEDWNLAAGYWRMLDMDKQETVSREVLYELEKGNLVNAYSRLMHLPDSVSAATPTGGYTGWMQLLDVEGDAVWAEGRAALPEWFAAPVKHSEILRYALYDGYKAYGENDLPRELTYFWQKVPQVLKVASTEHSKAAAPSKDDKRDSFYSKYGNRFDYAYGAHSCSICGGDSKHKKWPAQVGESETEECEAGQEGCCHSACDACCCGYHNYGEHDEWCEDFLQCHDSEPDCNCEGDGYCCHDWSWGSVHSEYCQLYEEEEDDSD